MTSQTQVEEFIENTDFVWNECYAGISQLERLLVAIPSSHSEIARTYYVPILYAYWERFFLSVFLEYLRVISIAGDSCKDYIHQLIGLRSSTEFKRAAGGLGKKRSIELIEYLRNLEDTPLDFPDTEKWIDTKSNVGKSVLGDTLEILGLDIEVIKTEIPFSLLKIEELRNRRNDIAHGSVIEEISKEKWESLVENVRKLMITLQTLLTDALSTRHPYK